MASAHNALLCTGRVNHAPWDGLHLADVVMPMFLFMVGCSMSLSHRRVVGSAPLLKKVLLRALKLVVVGWLTASASIWMGGEGLNLSTFRIPGILPRIAWANLVCALMAMYLPKYVKGKLVWGTADKLWPVIKVLLDVSSYCTSRKNRCAAVVSVHPPTPHNRNGSLSDPPFLPFPHLDHTTAAGCPPSTTRNTAHCLKCTCRTGVLRWL
jgi:hypothetical protein